MDIQVRLENIGVPLADFAAMFDDAARRWKQEPDSRYLGGILAAFQWVADLVPTAPLTGEATPATPASIRSERMAAEAVFHGWSWALPNIDREWALGVSSTLGWASGVLSRAPLKLASAARTA